jgi:DNA-binding transcriptional LysR family regulator
MIGARMGVGLAPREIAEQRIDESKVKILPLVEPWAHRQLVLGVRDYASLPPPARLLLDHLRSEA